MSKREKKPGNPIEWTPKLIAELGTIPDKLFAFRHHMGKESVAIKRKELGIESYGSKTRAKTPEEKKIKKAKADAARYLRKKKSILARNAKYIKGKGREINRKHSRKTQARYARECAPTYLANLMGIPTATLKKNPKLIQAKADQLLRHREILAECGKINGKAKSLVEPKT